MNRLTGLDGVRGIAAICVLIVHVFAHSSPDIAYSLNLQFLAYGLTAFFVLSGFLIYLPYASALLDERPRPSTSRFVGARVRRVFPGFLAIFLLVNFVFQASYLINPTPLDTARSDVGSGMITDPGQLLLNLSLVQSYARDSLQTGINPSWSLTTELAFYLVLWLMCVLIFSLRSRSRRRLITLAALPAALLLFVGAIGKTMVAVSAANHPDYSSPEAAFGANWTAVLSRSVLNFSDNFAFGMFAVVAYLLVKDGSVSPEGAKRLKRLATLIVIISPPFILHVSVFDTIYGDSLVAFVVAALVLVLVIPQALGETTALGRRLDTPLFRYSGEVSLGIYLWHFPVLLVLTRWGLLLPDTLLGAIGNCIVTFALSIAFATVTYRLVEKPAQVRKRQPA